jgi:hypothetical protein
MRLLLLALFVLPLFALAPLFAGDELPPVVYVPYDQTPTIDPKKQAVFMPYERFMALWEAAKPKPDQPVKPPVGATFGDYVLTGAVKGDLAEFTMTGTVTGLDTGWAQVVLPATLGLSGFTPGDDRLVLERTDKALVLHVRGTGLHKFTATVAAPVTGDAAGRRSLSLSLPAAGAGRLDLLVPQADAALTLTPAVAATTTPAKDGTRLLAVLGGTAQVQIGWQPPAAVATGEALILSDGEIRLTVGERSLRYDLALDLTILRRPLENVRIALPADAQVLAVDGKDVRTWERTAMGDAQVLTVSFHQPVSGSYALVVRMERAIDALTPGASRTLPVAWPSVVGAARATGRIAVVQGEGLVAAMESATGLSQVDPGETQTGAAAVAAYRFHAAPPESRLLVTRLASDLRAGIHQLVRLGREEDLIAVVLDLDVRKAGIFALALDVPATWELVDTGGLPLDDARLAAATGATRRLDLALRGRLLGAGQLTVRFKAPPSIPREAKAAAVATTTTVTVAKLVDVRQVRGTLAVATPSSWSLTSSARTGLTSTEVEVLRRDGLLANLARELKEDEDLPLGFTFLGADASTVLAIAPRARELNIRHEELVSVAEGHLRRLVTLRGEVRYSAAPSLRLSAPTELDTKLVFKGSALAEQTVVSRADGRSIWELRFQAPITGAFTITVEDQSEVKALTAGTPLPLKLQPLTVLDATRVSHICAVAREGTVEVSATAVGLETVAPADLPAGLRTQGVVAGFQGAASVAVDLTLVRHDLVTLADGAVTAARYLAVMSEERLLRVQGELLLSTRGRPYLELRLPAGAELLEVAIDRRQGRPSRRADGSVVIPLGDGAGLRSQVVAFVYEQRFSEGQLGAWGSLALELPRLNDKAAADAVKAAVTKDPGARPLPVGPVSFDLFLPVNLIPWGWRGDVAPTFEAEPLWGGVLARLQEQEQAQGREDVQLRSDGLTVPVALTGRRHHLARLGDGGELRVGFVSQGVLHLLALFALVLGGLSVWFARRRNEVVAGLALTAAVLAAAIAQPWLVVMGGFAVGVFAQLTILLTRNAVVAYRVARPAAVPQVVTPDPWLEQPKPLPIPVKVPASPEPPVTEPQTPPANDAKATDEKPQDPRP